LRDLASVYIILGFDQIRQHDPAGSNSREAITNLVLTRKLLDKGCQDRNQTNLPQKKENDLFDISMQSASAAAIRSAL
jgi:hypothetical protein